MKNDNFCNSKDCFETTLVVEVVRFVKYIEQKTEVSPEAEVQLINAKKDSLQRKQVESLC